MRGAVRTGARRVEVVDLPRPRLEPGTAVVRVHASGICGSDLHVYRHESQRRARPDGHEVAGEVVEVAPHPDGAGSQLKPGDLVAIDTICLGRACGACEWCQAGAPFHCQSKRRGDDWGGAFAEYIKRDVRGLFPLPAGMTVAQGALVEPLAVAVHALRLARLRSDERVAVIGAGTIGLCTLVAARAMGAGEVYLLARHEHQATLGRALGAAEVVIDGSPQRAAERVRDLAGGSGVDLVVETVGGDQPTLNQAWPMLRRRGRVAVLGLFQQDVPTDLSAPIGKEATVLFPVCYGVIDGRADFQVTVDLIASGKAPVERLMTHQLPLEQAQRAFEIADDKSSGSVKVHLQP